jgi:DNA sulfur modification protein DndC
MACYKTSDSALLDNTIETIQREYLKDSLPWSLAFSGGKDSSALLKLVYLALQDVGRKFKPVTVVYCDTGVEIPIIRSFVIQTLNSLQAEAEDNDMPIQTKIVTPNIEDRFFPKVIGRGYAPPSFKFRWCTDVLRIKPIKSFISTIDGQSIVLLGTRKGESVERDRVLAKHKTDGKYYFKQSNNKNAIIFSPIIEYGVNDVWSVLQKVTRPFSIDTEKLQMLYSVLTPSNSKELTESSLFKTNGRFGCWTCTVIRCDRAVENLIRDGQGSLKPLLEFRNWLAVIRDNPSYRLKNRRNGDTGLGPFTIEARKEILNRLLMTQNQTRWKLISPKELEYITNQWALDRNL